MLLRRPAFPFYVLLAALILACSWTTEFVVVNLTSEPVVMTYTAKEGCLLEPPSVATVGIHRRTQTGQLSHTDVEVSKLWTEADLFPGAAASERATTVTVPPMSALRFANLSSYIRPSIDQWSSFPVQDLTLTSSKGDLVLCGPALLVAFEGGKFQQLLLFFGSQSEVTSYGCEGAA